MDGLNLEENHLVSDNKCNVVNLYPPPQKIKNKKLQRMTNNVWLTFSVGGTTPQFTITIGQDNW